MATTNLTGLKDDRLAFSVVEAARLLGVSPGLLRLEITRGKLKPQRVGRRVVLSRKELDSYLARNQVEPRGTVRHQERA
jgi:excisionase family DNA binding protein